MEDYIRELTTADELAFEEAKRAKEFLNSFLEEKNKDVNNKIEKIDLFYLNCTFDEVLIEDQDIDSIKIYLRKIKCGINSFEYEQDDLHFKEKVKDYYGISNELFKKHLEIDGFSEQEFYSFSKSLFSIKSAINLLNDKPEIKDSLLVFNTDLHKPLNRNTKAYQLKDFFDEISTNLKKLKKILIERNCNIIEHFLDFRQYSDLLSIVDNKLLKKTGLLRSYKKLFENDYILLNNTDSIYQIILTKAWESNHIFPFWIDENFKIDKNRSCFYLRNTKDSPFYRNAVTFANFKIDIQYLYSVAKIISSLIEETHYGSF